MLEKVRKFGEQHIRYKLDQWKQTGMFDILNNISGHVILVQLIYSLGNFNHVFSVIVAWLFNPNCKKSWQLTIESFNFICVCSHEDQYIAILQEVFMK